jgi:hypothetical protein
MEYTHKDHCAALLTRGTCNIRAGTAAWEYGLRHPDADVFQRLEQLLREKSAATATHTNEGRPMAVRTPANQDGISCGARTAEKLKR